MHGVFTYLHHKHQPFMWVNIPFVPWIRLGVHDFLKKVHALRKKHGRFDKKLRDLVFSESVYWVDLSKYLGVYLEIAGWKKPLSRLIGVHPKDLVTWKINPKDRLVLSLGDVGFLLFFRVVSGDYGKLR